MAQMGIPADWRATSESGMNASMNLRMDSSGHRMHCAQVDNDTRLMQKDAQTTVNNTLDAKLAELQKHSKSLDTTIKSGLPVLDKLKQTKAMCEKEIADKTKLLQINKDRIAIRLGRPASENIYDPAQEQLDSQTNVIAHAIEVQNKCLEDTNTMIKKMDNQQAIMTADLKDKKAAEDLEKKCIGPSQYHSKDVEHLGSFVSRVSPEAQMNDLSVTEQPTSWCAKSEWNVSKGEQTQSDALKLCANCEELCRKSHNETEEVHAKVQTAMKNKLIETCELWEGLMSHKAETENEIANCIEQKNQLEEAIAHKTVPLNTAQTRFDIRTQRPEREAVEDDVHIAIKDELSKITYIVAELKQKLQEMNSLIQSHIRTRDELLNDIKLKETAIHLDSDCFTYPGKKDTRLVGDVPRVKAYVTTKAVTKHLR